MVFSSLVFLFVSPVVQYLGFLLGNVQAISGVPEFVPEIMLPIGISLCAFQLVSYTVDVRCGDAFAPLLVDGYETTHVVGFREAGRNLYDCVRDNAVKDVILPTGMKIGPAESVAATLLSEVS